MIIPPAQYLVDDEGRKTAVLLPITTYEKLLEDLHDLAIVAQRREERPINLNELLERLGIDGELQSAIQTNS